ncbi:glycoside hydrolase domain-containing protein [Streptacidiphilus melanogenes]|uniref:glycoside hydrolase domain-containing protein n=1 Tax=Streptacidiphilus melanogenes TaxID=411235 RepID=UPI0005A73E31|nr:glycoside hydrolase domain-containing protein [Streptacidiphilus melanogenes]
MCSLLCAMLALVFVPALVSPTEAAATSRRDLSQVFTGQAFDTCSAPSPSLLRAWRHHSSYGALGLYIGGRNRACSQPLLNRGYVRAAADMGWRMLPLYVGAQAPCVTAEHNRTKRISYANAFEQGRSDGEDAVSAASSLGLAPGSPVYLDMEAYARDRGRCSMAVLRYTTAWSRALHEAGYLSGFYSSADSGVADLADLASLAVTGGDEPPPLDGLPDVVWYARWDHRRSTDGYRALDRSLWSGHQRVHQYVGNVAESHGGQSAMIDRNSVDAPVAVVQ